MKIAIHEPPPKDTKHLKIRTKDLWQSAFMISKGSVLKDVTRHSNGKGKPEVFFILTGENMDHLIQEFKSGQAVCQVSQLRASMIHLKEEIYKVI